MIHYGNPTEKRNNPNIIRYEDIDYSRCLKVEKTSVRGKALLSGGVLTEWRKGWLYGSKKDY